MTEITSIKRGAGVFPERKNKEPDFIVTNLRTFISTSLTSHFNQRPPSGQVQTPVNCFFTVFW